MWRERALIVLVFLLHLIHGENACPPSSCGKISNISYPFRLKGDQGCGRSIYELSCENNITLFSLVSGTFHVQAINYHNFTIRLVNPTLQQSNRSSLPCYFFSPSNFTTSYRSYLLYETPNHGSYLTIPWIYGSDHYTEPQHIVLLNCSHRVTGKRTYVDTGGCMNWEWKGYIYAMAGDLIAEDFEVGCHVKLVALTSWWGLDTNTYSYDMMHTALLYGFDLSWLSMICEDRCGPTYCYFNSFSQTLECEKEGRRYWWQPYNLVEYARLRPRWMKYVFGVDL
ncbi:hypothetical protein PHAVU_001G068600 [Phaseolus vulgaris]